MTLRAVVFDFGETLLSEARAWDAWADQLGVERSRFAAELAAVIAQRRDHREVFRRFGTDWETAEAARAAAGEPPHPAYYDPYPDAAPALARLRAAGLRVAAAGNQPEGAEAALSRLLVPGELIATSAGWGVAKPDPRFFTRLLAELDLAPETVAYVGDRVDNDVLPAADAGLVTVHLRRGPWGEIHAGWPEAARATIRADDLQEAAGHLLARNG
jgi:FMN hydrolase / 5-amino-6-(5-phospho-D-ribitylamino)uracil phosphatase